VVALEVGDAAERVDQARRIRCCLVGDPLDYEIELG